MRNFKTETKLFIFFFALICLIIILPRLSQAQQRETKTIKANSNQIVNDVAAQLTSYKNKYGRVSLTKVNPLSINSHDANGTSFHMGITLLTQDDSIASPGVGAIFQF